MSVFECFWLGYLGGTVLGFVLLFLFGQKVVEWAMRRWPL